MLIAFITLAYVEGVGRITYAMLSEREKVVRMVLKLFGLLPGPFAVVPIADIHSGQVDIERSAFGNTNAMVTIHGAGGDRLGMLVNMVIAPTSSSLISRPLDSQGMGSLLSRQSLSTVLNADKEYITTHCRTVPSSGSSSSSLVVADSAVKENFKASKLEVKFALSERNPTTLCAHFSLEAWATVKESAFTAHIGKMQSMFHEASMSGEDKVIRKSEVWVSGLSNGKQFVKLYREYCKTVHGKAQKLAEMFEPVKQFKVFLQDTLHIDTHFRLDFLYQQMVFHSTVSGAKPKDNPCSKALQLMCDHGLSKVLKVAADPPPDVADHSGQFSPAAWLNGLVFTCFSDVLKSEDSDQTDNNTQIVAAGLLQDVRSTKSLLGELVKDLPSIEIMLQDVGHYESIIAATSDSEAVVGSELKGIGCPVFGSHVRDERGLERNSGGQGYPCRGHLSFASRCERRDGSRKVAHGDEVALRRPFADFDGGHEAPRKCIDLELRHALRHVHC